MESASLFARKICQHPTPAPDQSYAILAQRHRCTMVDPDFNFTNLSPSDVRVGAALSEISRRGGQASVLTHGKQTRHGGQVGGQASVLTHGKQMRNGDQASVLTNGEQMRHDGQASVLTHGEQMRNVGQASVLTHGEQMRHGGQASALTHGEQMRHGGQADAHQAQNVIRCAYVHTGAGMVACGRFA